MAQNSYARVAILCSGDLEARRNATAENNRFADLFRAFAARRIYVEPATYHDDFCDEVENSSCGLTAFWYGSIRLKADGTGPRSILCFVMSQPLAFLSARTPTSS